MKEESKLMRPALNTSYCSPLPGAKRKAEEEPESPSAAKRVKHDDDASEETEKKPEMKRIPFPEKVRWMRSPLLHICGR